MADCVGALRAGRLVVLPTETGYMLAANATSADAVDLLYEAKGRPTAQPTHVAVASASMMSGLVDLPPAAARVCSALMPGPVTVVAESLGLVPERLSAGTGTLGVRVPDCPSTLQVLAAFGGPLTATSLNRAGEPPPDDPLNARLDVPPELIVVDPAARTYSSPSTLVSFAETPWKILREGPVSADAIAAAVG